ncbi:MAG: hypothetical protein ACI4S2_12405 [Lachnospiraceae bacterium]
MNRLEELKALFETVEEDKQKLAAQLLEEGEFLERQLQEVRKLPFIKVHPDNPELQKRTEASRLYKEHIQSYCNVIKILNSILQKNSVEEADEFDEFAADFGL